MKWHRKNTSFGIWDDEGRRIAVIVQDHPNEAMNSRLIAAAPQLLEALRNACLAMTAIRFGATDCYETSMAESRSAIAAATVPALEPTRNQVIADLAEQLAFGEPTDAHIICAAQMLEETERAATARRNEECQTRNATPSA